ncbi:hypothetical protein V6N12_049139 [Hibiscus sabdariffa]|uniref:Uncharacterized protein n=1 Tax=Hibiscus sabdariffa TaxID=183260 RepID=A0ABR2EJA5_9ROSI
MFSFPPHSSVTYSNGTNLPKNLASPADPSLRTPPADRRVSVVIFASVHPLEWLGSPILEFDQQSSKWGKTSDPVFVLNDLKTMEVDDHRNLVAVDSILSLDGMVVTIDDVKVEKSGSFPSVEFSERIILGLNAPLGQRDVDVYGPWMLAQTRRRQMRKEINHPKGITSPVDHSSGSWFSILEEVNGEGMITTEVVTRDTGVESIKRIESRPNVQMSSASIQNSQELEGGRKTPSRGFYMRLRLLHLTE